jgi:hypothetical protein
MLHPVTKKPLTLAEGIAAVVASRNPTPIPAAAIENEEWDNLFPLQKGEWKFTYPMLPPAQSFLTLGKKFLGHWVKHLDGSVKIRVYCDI